MLIKFILIIILLQFSIINIMVHFIYYDRIVNILKTIIYRYTVIIHHQSGATVCFSL